MVWPLSVNQSPVWRLMDELMAVVSQNSSSPRIQAFSHCFDLPLYLLSERSSLLCGRNHCRLAQTAVLSRQDLCVAPLNRWLNPQFFLCRLSLWVGGRAASSFSAKFNTLPSCLSHRVFSFYSIITRQNDICELRKGWVFKSLSPLSLTAIACVSGSSDSLVLWSAHTWCPAVLLCFIPCTRRYMPRRKFISWGKEWVDCSCLIGLASWLETPLSPPPYRSTHLLPLSV